MICDTVIKLVCEMCDDDVFFPFQSSLLFHVGLCLF